MPRLNGTDIRYYYQSNKDSMMNKRYLGIILAISFMVISFNGFACSMAGDNKHIGNIVGVDSTQQTFTILDAETRKKISFIATSAQIESLTGKQAVEVTFDINDKDAFVATELVFI